MKRTGLVAVAACLFAASFAQTASAGIATTTNEIRRDDLEGVPQLSLAFNLLAANVTFVRSDDPDLVARAVVRYDDEFREAPTVTAHIAETGSTVTFNAAAPKGISFDSARNVVEWEITLGPIDLPLDLSFNGLAYNAASGIELGGLPLRKLWIGGTGSVFAVDFATPTTLSTEKITVVPLGGGYSMTNIGNTDAKKFELLGSGAAGYLDFRGNYRTARHHVGSVGAGHIATLILPADAGEWLFGSGVSLVAGDIFDSSQWKQQDVWGLNMKTTNYDTAAVTLDVQLEWQLGAVFIVERKAPGEPGDTPPLSEEELGAMWE